MKLFKRPDLHAPRYRPRIIDLVNQDFFTAFKLQYPQYAGISNKDLKEKIQLINGELWNKVLELRDGVELPKGLGCLFIGSCPRKKGDNPDYRQSALYSKKIQHRNWESDNYIAKIFYTNYEQKYRFRYHELWGFKAVRQFKRAVAAVYPLNWKRYLLVDNWQQISRLFRKQSYKMKRRQQEVMALDDYDEFDLD